jgi:hypothetical protein
MEAERMKHGLFGRIALALIIAAAPLSMALSPAQATGDRSDWPTVGTSLRVRLNHTLSSKKSVVGDRFTATVVGGPYRGATINGRVRSIRPSGRIKGATEMHLSFDKITLLNRRTSPMSADVVRLYDSSSGDKVDDEGNITSPGQGKSTVTRAGIGAVGGAIFGGIFGGGKGAAIGSAVGGAAGVGSKAVGSSQELRIEAGTEMLIRVTR